MPQTTHEPPDRHPKSPNSSGGGVLRDGGAARAATVLAFVGIVLLGGCLALLAPLALGGLSGPTPQWERLSFIAQVMGVGFAAIAVLAGAAAVIALWIQARALTFQAREYRAAREQAIRAEHRELLKMAMDDRRLHGVWGGATDPSLSDDDDDALTYANMLVGFWQMAYHGGAIPEAEVRLQARTFFTGRIGRAYWAGARSDRAETTRDDAERRFHEIFDEEYTTAIHRPPAPDTPMTSVPGPRPGKRARAVLAGAGLVVAGVVGYAFGRRRGH